MHYKGPESRAGQSSPTPQQRACQHRLCSSSREWTSQEGFEERCDKDAPTRERGDRAKGQHQAFLAMGTQARIRLGLEDGFEPIEEDEFGDDGEFGWQAKQTTGVLEFLTARGVMEAKVADADKASRQDM